MRSSTVVLVVELKVGTRVVDGRNGSFRWTSSCLLVDSEEDPTITGLVVGSNPSLSTGEGESSETEVDTVGRLCSECE